MKKGVRNADRYNPLLIKNHGFWDSEKFLVLQTALQYKPWLIFFQVFIIIQFRTWAGMGAAYCGAARVRIKAWVGNLKQRVPITSKSSNFKCETQQYVVKLPKSAGARQYCPKILRMPSTLGTRAYSSPARTNFQQSLLSIYQKSMT